MVWIKELMNLTELPTICTHVHMYITHTHMSGHKHFYWHEFAIPDNYLYSIKYIYVALYKIQCKLEHDYTCT